MCSIEYPFSNITDGCLLMQGLRQSGLVTADPLEGIAYENAEALLNVKANQHP